MAIQMTRAEYEARYGAQPELPKTRVQMTRAEYEAKYGEAPSLPKITKQPGFVQGIVQSVANPFLRVGLNARNAYRAAKGKEDIETADAGYFGEVKKIPGYLDASPTQQLKQSIGVGADIASNVIPAGTGGKIIKAGLKGQVLKAVGTGAVTGATSGALAGFGKASGEGKDLKDVGIETGIGGIGGLIFGGVLGGVAPLTRAGTKTAIEGIKGGVEVASRARAVSRGPTQAVLDREKQNFKEALEDAFSEKATLRKKNELAKRYGVDPAEVFAQHGAVPKVVDGKMDTIEIVEGFQDSITTRRNFRRKSLEQLQTVAPEVTSTKMDEFEKAVLNGIANDRDAQTQGLVKQYQNLARQRIADFRRTYGDSIDLLTLDDINSGQNKLNNAFKTTQYDAGVAEYISRVARDLLEKKTENTGLRNVNKEIRDLINAKEIAEKMNGTAIKYGKFSEWMATILGAAISQGVPFGPLLGAIGGKAVLRMIQQNAFGGPLQRRILQYLYDDQALLRQISKEMAENERNLLMKEVEKSLEVPRLPAPKEGTPKVQNNVPINLPKKTQTTELMEDIKGGIKINKNTQMNAFGAMAGIEFDEETGEIKFNQEKAALGLAGVAGTTKGTQYLKSLGQKEIDTIVKRMDNLDKKLFTKFVDYYKLKEKENPSLEIAARRVMELMKINPNQPNSKVAEIFTKLLDARRTLEKKPLVGNNAVMKSAIPKELEPLAQEARKYKSAEEFVGAKANLFHGTPAKFDKFDLNYFGKSDDGFAGKGIYLTNDRGIAKYFADDWTSKAYPNKRVGNVMEVFGDIKKPLEVTSYREIGQKLGLKTDTGLTKNIKANADQIATKAKELGYDSIIVKDFDKSGKAVNEVVIFDQNKVFTKSQLIDLYNKVKGKR